MDTYQHKTYGELPVISLQNMEEVKRQAQWEIDAEWFDHEVALEKARLRRRLNLWHRFVEWLPFYIIWK